jgi:hypothetical protein
MDRKSAHYVRSSYERGLYGNDEYTTMERRFSMDGNSVEDIRPSYAWVKSSVMS